MEDRISKGSLRDAEGKQRQAEDHGWKIWVLKGSLEISRGKLESVVGRQITWGLWFDDRSSNGYLLDAGGQKCKLTYMVGRYEQYRILRIRWS